MIFANPISKRKRIADLVKKSIENAELVENYVSSSGLLIKDIVDSFTEMWPNTYFDIGDDRKLAGLVLAYMMEISEIDIDEANDYGYRLLKLVYKVNETELINHAPYTHARLHQHI